MIVASWLISSNLVEKSRKIRILFNGICNMLGKSNKLFSWVASLLNVVFLSVDGMKHLIGHEDMIPSVDIFL